MADDSGSPVERLKNIWGQIKDHEDQMQSCVDDMIAYNESLERKLAEAESELMDKKDAIRILRLDLQNKDSDIANRTSVSKEDGGDSVLILVDNNHLAFKSDLVTAGKAGGQDAATLLREAVLVYNDKDNNKSVSTAAKPASIIIRIFGDSRGLSASYRSRQEFYNFVRGFSSVFDECDFVDVGEDTTAKVQAMLQSLVTNNRYKKILFGGASNEVYSNFLQTVANDKFALITGPPLPLALGAVSEKLGSVSFEAVFDTALPQAYRSLKRKTSHETMQPAGPPQPDGPPHSADTPQPTRLPSPVVQPQSADPPLSSQLAEAFGSPVTHKSAQPVGVVPPFSFGSTPPATGCGTFGPFSVANPLDLAGQQDSSQTMSFKKPTQSFLPPRTYKELVTRDYCPTYHILGRCDFAFGDFGTCKKIHGLRLEPADIEKLANEARQVQCIKGAMCSLRDCVYGHRHIKRGTSRLI